MMTSTKTSTLLAALFLAAAASAADLPPPTVRVKDTVLVSKKYMCHDQKNQYSYHFDNLCLSEIISL